MRRLVGSALVGLVTTALAAGLLAPVALASPIGDAEAAIMAAWEKAGGDTSPLGARKGDVYPVADGFALDFDGGKMFYTTDTGAKFVFGPILDKYESLGGPAGSDLGFPTINEVPGLAGPDSRVATFSASDKPVIFWTSDHGAFVVRGAMNAAWDKLGSSGGVLGAPVGDETYGGEVTSQKFSGGQVSWNRQTKQFTTEPASLGDQLKGLQVPIDPTAAINMAWRAAGGTTGPLGAKQGGHYPIGGDGIAQNFAGGKVFFSPATGANAVESDILAKYESLGGPVGSDLGFPVGNESDGGIGPASRVCTFSAADKPVIFWTSDHGAFVVRGAMKVAWDKLRGAAGKLGAPVGDQSLDGDVISQQFAGGKISWNRSKNTFSTDPANLAPLLTGLQVPGQNQPSGAAAPPAHAKKFTWHWWWLLAAVPVLVLIVLSGLVAFGWRRRRAAQGVAPYEQRPEDVGYDTAPDQHWGYEDADVSGEHYPPVDVHPAEMHEPAGPASRVSWRRGGAVAVAGAVPDAAGYDRFGDGFGAGAEEPDTDSIPIVSDADLAQAYPEAGYLQVDDRDHVEADTAEGGYPPAVYAGVALETAPDDHAAGVDEAGDWVYPDAAGIHADAEVVTPEAAAPEAAASVAGMFGDVTPEDAINLSAGAGGEPTTGRHAAIEPDDADGVAAWPVGANLAPAGRPAIHLPLDDPYQPPDGYPIKANASVGLYYTPGSALYHDTLAEIWLANEDVARANGFIKAD
ncbi:LGFP repeat-containing protein [Mycobacterium sp. 050134]|uniref:LGFP repeat-containing protein n=1 Tax=Mycobacterium sp. 050134 TaxID=3096111 RepID=UPI002EDA97AC